MDVENNQEDPKVANEKPYDTRLILQSHTEICATQHQHPGHI